MVHAVSRAAVGVANSLDNAIEQLMEGWASPLDRGARRRTSQGARAAAGPSSSAAAAAPTAPVGCGDMHSLVRQRSSPVPCIDDSARRCCSVCRRFRDRRKFHHLAGLPWPAGKRFERHLRSDARCDLLAGCVVLSF